MQTRFLMLFLCCALAPGLSAQTLKGEIRDKEGAPVVNASVYIREIAQGIMADDKGEFQVRLKDGEYTFDFSSLGYEKKTLPVKIGKASASLSIEMERKTYVIREVVVRPNREDPAYAVMRKAIARAPFFLHQVKSYESEVYIKGSVKVDKVPALLKLNVDGKNLKNLTKRLFLMESQNKVLFTAPDKYEQTVLAFSSTIPEEISGGSMMRIVSGNIYDPNVMGWISPLSPGAFSYYKFAFESISREGEHWVNKIRVQPKMKNARLVNGWLYIVEGNWNVYYVDLNATEMGVKINLKTSYNEVKPLAFLPSAYNIDVNIGIMGVKAAGKYYSSVQYKDVELNETPELIRKTDQAPTAQAAPAEKPQTKKQQKAQQQLQELASKENLSNRDAYRMARLIRETVEPEERKKERESLELINNRRSIEVKVDSLAQARDSIYWAEIRDLPLREEEIRSYREKDSLEIRDSLSFDNKTVVYIPQGKSAKYLMGDRVRLNSKQVFKHNGLLGTLGGYNFADGFQLGHRLAWELDFTPHRSLHILPAAYYATARRSVLWQVDAQYRYAPSRNAELFVSGGNTSADFNSESGNMRLINSVASLFFAKSPVKFYRKKFVEVRHRIDVANGLQLAAGFAYEKRNTLENKTSFSFFGGQPPSNIPGEGRRLFMPDHALFKASIQASYTPRHYYRIIRGRKEYAHSAYPTFSLRYEKGFPAGQFPFVSYNRLEAGVRQTVRLNIFDSFAYMLNAGTFLFSGSACLPDYKHFDTNELFVSGSSAESSFSLLDNYAYSTLDEWLQAHLSYTSNYLLVKRLSFLQNYLFDEALHLRTVRIRGKNHIETGYSLGFGDTGRLGFFVAFGNGRYSAAGFSLSLPLLKEMGVK